MSVISTYTARVTISVFITIIALLPNTSNGQSNEQNYYNYRRGERFNSDSSKYESGSSPSILPKDHVPNRHIRDTNRSDAKEIPLEFFQLINNVTDSEEFIQNFLDEYERQNFFGSSNFERSAAQMAKVANCEPTLQVVPLEPYGSPQSDPDVYYFPKCTRIKQCNGCCNSPLLVCTPIETQENLFLVMKLKYSSNGSSLLGKEPISILEHTRCACQCRVKEEHCNAYQRYDSKNCKCVCDNKDEKDKCQSEKGKIWDHTNCTCGCRNEVPCTTGSFFDKKTCRCEEIRVGNSRK
ncbi:PDGFB family protein [Megaselia abdita]